MAKLDLTGKRSGRLTAIAPTERRDKCGGVIWLCKCDCGKEHCVSAANFKRGAVMSCGCLPRDLCRELGKDGQRRVTHGGSHTRLYRIWGNMLRRCNNPKNNSYKNYGGRGITVCEEWKESFASFQAWALSHGYRDDLSIDRIDNDGDYCPSNCRWVTNVEQANNKRPRRWKPDKEKFPKYEIDGMKKTSSEWASIAGIKQSTFLCRWERGDRGKDLIRPTYQRVTTRRGVRS